MKHQAVANQAAIHKNENRIAIALLYLRPRNEPRYTEDSLRRIVIRPRLVAIFGNRLGWRHAGRGKEQLALPYSEIHQFFEHPASEDRSEERRVGKECRSP